MLGFGREHDRAVRAYEEIARDNTHVRVVPLTGETDPAAIAGTLLRMMA